MEAINGLGRVLSTLNQRQLHNFQRVGLLYFTFLEPTDKIPSYIMLLAIST